MAVRRGTFFTGMLAATVLAGGSCRAVAGRAVQVSGCPPRARDLDRSQRLGGRRSHRRLHGLPDQLPAVPQGIPPARSPSGGPGAVGSLPARREPQARDCRGGARVLRGELPAGADHQARRRGRLPDRLLRADRAGLALPESGISGSALSPPARSRSARLQAGFVELPQQQDRADRPPQRQGRDRALSRPRARSRPARSTASISKSAGCATGSRR